MKRTLPTIEECAERAAAGLAAYKTACKLEGESDWLVVSLFLSDLMHFSDRAGLDFCERFDSACEDYQLELSRQ